MLIRPLVACLLALLPVVAPAATWQTLSAEAGRRVEIDRDSIQKGADGKATALGRIVLDKPISDARTSSSYRIIEALSRYDCGARSYSTIKRTYFQAPGEVLREEEIKVPIEMPVRSGSLDDKLLREVCRPRPGGESQRAASQAAAKASEVADDLRKANEAMIRKEVSKEVHRATLPMAAGPTEGKVRAEKPAAPAAAPIAPRPVQPAPVAAPRARPQPAPAPAPRAPVAWSYEGEGGPDHWGRLKPEYATCAEGRRQSPIDIRDGIRVDLEPLVFNYRPSPFRIIDTGRTLQVAVSGSSFTLLGERYELVHLEFHRTAEIRIDGKTFDMGAHFVHKSAEGRIAIVAVQFEKGREHPLVQMIWNYLPLERNTPVSPPGLVLDVTQLLPERTPYYTFMGSLTTPPCTEGVLWLVLKQPVMLSAEQIAIFSRLYRDNARPVQPTFGRLIKESR